MIWGQRGPFFFCYSRTSLTGNLERKAHNKQEPRGVAKVEYKACSYDLEPSLLLTAVQVLARGVEGHKKDPRGSSFQQLAASFAATSCQLPAFAAVPVPVICALWGVANLPKEPPVRAPIRIPLHVSHNFYQELENFDRTTNASSCHQQKASSPSPLHHRNHTRCSPNCLTSLIPFQHRHRQHSFCRTKAHELSAFSYHVILATFLFFCFSFTATLCGRLANGRGQRNGKSENRAGTHTHRHQKKHEAEVHDAWSVL